MNILPFAAVVLILSLAGVSRAQNHSQVFFDASGTDQGAFGGNQTITISGNVTYYGRRDPKPEGSVVGTVVQDFVQPASDVYIVTHGYYHGSGAANLHLFLEDVNGAPNTVLGIGGGGFFEQVIGSTGPQGPLRSGEYDLVIDEHQNGYFEPTFDLYLGGRDQAPAIVVAVPIDAPVLPNPGIAAMKAAGQAQYNSAALLNAAFRVIEIAYDKIAEDGMKATVKEVFNTIKKEFKKPPDDDAPFKLGFTAARNALANKMKHGLGLVADPADEGYAELVLLAPATLAAETDADPLFAAAGAFANALDREARLEAALLSSLEKYQGARDAHDGRWTLAHARGIRHFAGLLSSEISSNQPVWNAMHAATVASTFDFDSLLTGRRNLQSRLQTSGLSAAERQFLADLGLSGAQMEAALREFVSTAVPASRAGWLAAVDAKLAASAAGPAGLTQLATEMNAVITALLALPSIDRDDPTISAMEPFSGVVGTALTLSASATDAHGRGMVFEWDLDGDGDFDDAAGATLQAAFPRAVKAFAAVRVTNDGGRSNVAYAPLTITTTNQAPVFQAATPPATAAEVEVGATQGFSIMATDPNGGPPTLRWTLDGTEVGAGATFSFTPSAPEQGLRELAVTASDSQGGETTRVWMVMVTRPSPLADLSLTMEVPETPVLTGAEFTWAMTVENAGPAASPEVVVTQTLPAGLTFVRGSVSFGSLVEDNGTVTATLGTIAKGGLATVWVQTTAAQAGIFQSAGSVTGGAADLVAANQSVSARVRVNLPSPLSANLSLAATIAPTAATLGANQTITLTTTNMGPDGATGLVVEVELPESVDFVSSTPAAASSDNGLVRLNLPNAASGANAMATLVVRPTQAGSAPAFARVLGAQLEADYSDNDAAVTIAAVTMPPPISDLVVSQTPPPGIVRVGEPATWHLTVKNNGPAPAANVRVLDRLPGGADWSGADPAPDSLGGGQAAFLAGTLASGASRSLEVTVVPRFAGIAANVVTASSDSVDANGAVSSSSITVMPEPTTSADLGATVTSSAAAGALATSLTLTLTVSNAGPDEATSAVADLILPDGLAFVSATPSQGTATHSDGVVRAELGLLANGATATVNIVVRLTAARPFTVLATVSSADRDPAAANDRASITVLGTDPEASVAVIQNLADPEITKLQEYLTQMGLSSQVFDDEELTAAQLSTFRLVIWDDLSYAAFGIRPPLIEVLEAVADSGRPLYLIGDDLAYVATYALIEPYASRWTQLLHLKATRDNGNGGGMTLVDSRHPVVRGPFGLAGNSAYVWDPDITTRTGAAGEILLGTYAAAASHTLVAFRDPITYRKSLTQNELVYTQVPAVADREERRKLFQNGVAWLLAPDAVADLALTASAVPADVSVGSQVRVDLVVTNQGPDLAQQARLTANVPAGLALVRTSLPASEVSLDAGILTLYPGSLAAGESRTVSVFLSGGTLGDYVLQAMAGSYSEDPSAADNNAMLPVRVVPAVSARSIATYQFQDTLAACEPAAPPLVGINPLNANTFASAPVAGQTRRVYHWDGNRSAGQTAGLSLATAGLLPPDNYSVEMLFRFTEEVGAVRRLIDASNRVNNSGVSLNALSHLQTGAAVPGTAIAPPGEFHHVVVTVAPGGKVTTYLDGIEQSVLGAVTGLNLTAPGLLHFFATNTVGTGSTDFSDGEIALLRVYDGVLSVNRAAAQAAYPFGPDAPMDALRDFSIAHNSNGVWSYGYSTTRGTPFLFSSSNSGGYGPAAAKIIKTATFNGHLYHLIDQSFWPEAEDVAVALGGHLATIESAGENDFIYRIFGPLVRSASAARSVSLWIGLNDVATEGTFDWSSGTPVSYTNWIGGEPRGTSADEDYAGIALFAFGQPGQWHDIVGDDRLGDVTFGVVEVEALPQLLAWSGTADGPHIVANTWESVVGYASIIQPPDLLNFDPGNDARNVVLRWTAPVGGVYRVMGRFQGIDVFPNGTDVAVLRNGDTAATLFEDYVTGFEMRKPFDVTVTLGMGETVDFSVGIGGNSNLFDSTGVDAVVMPLMLTDECAAGTDLAVTQTFSPSAAAPGQTVTDTIAVSNAGLRPAPGVVVSFVAPAGLDIVGVSTGSNVTEIAGNVVTVRFGTLGTGQNAQIEMLLQGTAPGTFDCRAQVNGTTFDEAPANNASTAQLSLGAVIPLATSVRSTVDDAVVGEEITFNLVIANAGTLAAPSASLTATLPLGTTFVSATGGAIPQDGLVFFPPQPLAAGQTVGYQIRVRADMAGMAEMQASAAGPAGSSVLGAEASGVVTVTAPVVLPDLHLTIATNPAVPIAGCQVLYTFTVTNESPAPAEGTVLRAPIPAGLVVISTAASQGTVRFDAGLLRADLNTVLLGTPTTVTLVAVAPAAEPLLVGATVGGDLLPTSSGTTFVRRNVQIPQVGSPCAVPVAVTLFAAPDEQSYRLEWTATPGRLYWIEFSDDLAYWRFVPTTVTAVSALESWVDPGPPSTSSPPLASPERFYRLYEMPPP